MKRFTKNISKKQTYCGYELKDCRYQEIFEEVEKYSDIEDIAPCELTLAIDKLGKLEDIEEKLGISLIDFYKIIQARHIWAEIGLDLTNRFDELVLFDIKEFDVELNRILLKENKYNLRSIPFNMYKICFWLSKDKSE